MLTSIAIDSVARRSFRRGTLYLAAAAIVLMVAGCATMGAPRPAAITVPQIVAMAKAGVSADDIIAQIQASGTVYRLKASQLAELEQEGVPAKVINYMQETYLTAVKRDTRYQDEQYWTNDNDYLYGGDPYGWGGDDGGFGGGDDEGGGDDDDGDGDGSR